ncbi:hypothetical protein PK28_07450 [Hymenobacter sp. DG25B]|nr:hypothetical protein PK28_07450 [Hymenobacter sp. DG25B]
MFVQGQPLDPARTYSAAFITAQGVPAKLGQQRRKTSHHAVAAMRAYLEQHRPLAVAHYHTFVVV